MPGHIWKNRLVWKQNTSRNFPEMGDRSYVECLDGRSKTINQFIFQKTQEICTYGTFSTNCGMKEWLRTQDSTK